MRSPERCHRNLSDEGIKKPPSRNQKMQWETATHVALHCASACTWTQPEVFMISAALRPCCSLSTSHQRRHSNHIVDLQHSARQGLVPLATLPTWEHYITTRHTIRSTASTNHSMLVALTPAPSWRSFNRVARRRSYQLARHCTQSRSLIAMAAENSSSSPQTSTQDPRQRNSSFAN